MRTKIIVTLLILGVSTGVVALQCRNLNIKLDAHDTTCSSCNQWATGRVVKEGSDDGLLCVYLCDKHSFNVCDNTMTLWVGTQWGFNCFDVPSDCSSVNWALESSRQDWQDSRGAWAEVYIYIPCFNCQERHVNAVWSRLCYYCDNCTP